VTCETGAPEGAGAAAHGAPEGAGAAAHGAPARVGTARRRAELALAARDGDERTVRRALLDEAASVRAGALAALVRAGWAGEADGARACRDPAALVRRVACELAPCLPGSDYEALLGDGDPLVVEAAAYALGELGDAAAVPPLAEIASQHPDPLCRESAVAALGAIGDGRGLPAVLGALAGPPALRRRAVVALAAFSGEAVEGALRAATKDRDWQVRQAAAAVLGDGDGDAGSSAP
jgi:HEAT repeat protein